MTALPAFGRKIVEGRATRTYGAVHRRVGATGPTPGGFKTFSHARALATAIVAILLVVAHGTAQSAPTPQNNPAQQPAPKSGGQVIFSRSSDENGATKTEVGPGAKPALAMASQPSVEDADRLAVTFTNLDLDVRLQTAAHQIAVRARLTVRNDSKAPLARIPLQISSSLNWEQIRLAGRTVSCPIATLNSDSDHTGQLHEAAVPLPEALAPGRSVQLDVVYSGTIPASAERLLTVGTPQSMALHSDWDQISPSFTGLRGFGNVVWYPVSSVPVILGDGARLFDEIGRHKLRLSGAHFTLHLTVEFPHGQPPTVALINGLPANLAVADANGLDADLAGIATASLTNATLGFEAPSLFVAIRKSHPGSGLIAWTIPDNEVAVQFWVDAASTVLPFVQSWLGVRPRTQLTLLDLPDPDDAPFETGAMLVTSLQEGPADKLDGVLVHALTHAFTEPSSEPVPAWLNEGLATFMESLWVEKRHGRDQALGMLEADRAALALAEPASPGESTGTPLAQAIAPIYYRTKAAYVLWMLRDLTSDDALASALRTYYTDTPDANIIKNSGSACPLQALLKKAGVDRDLSWFFADWVDADKGLPDLTISGVFPNGASAGTVLVAVNITNAGYADVEVPVIVRTANNLVSERVFLPARGKAVERLLVISAPTQVQVNDGTAPETQASVHVTDIDQPSSGQHPAGTSSSGQQPAPQ
jgi:hypothetical protein